MPHETIQLDAFDTLVRARRDETDGELVVAGPAIEAHVWLSKGRLAWATSSTAGTPFTKHLRAHGVDRDAIVEVVRECSRTNASLIGTCTAWGVASAELVREAHLIQICESLATLCGPTALRALFLPKRLEYDARHTFSLGEVAAACTGHLASVGAAIHAAFQRHGVSRTPGPPNNDSDNDNDNDSNSDSDSDSNSNSNSNNTTNDDRRIHMATAKETLPKLMEIDGCIGACIVDSNSGMMLGAVGGGPVDLEIAAAGNTEVVRAKRNTMTALKLTESIEDILITLGQQYHVIRPLASNDALFIYLVLDKAKANLAMARHQLRSIESELVV